MRTHQSDWTPNEMFQYDCSSMTLADHPTNGDYETHSQVLVQTLNALVAETDLGRFLDKLLMAVMEETGAHSYSLWLRDSTEKALTFYEAAHYKRTPNGLRRSQRSFPAKSGFLSRESVSRRNGPWVVRDLARSDLIESGAKNWMVRQGITSLLCSPLRIGENILGVLALHAHSPASFTAGHETAVRLVADEVSLAVHVKSLAKRQEEAAVLRERGRIAQEIHDSLGQYLAAITIRLELARDSFSKDPRDALTHVLAAQELARETLTEARRSVWDLLPGKLEVSELPVAMRELCAHLTEGMNAKMAFAVRGHPHPLVQQTEVHLLRIMQEAVNNALRHGSASRVRIRLSYGAEKAKLWIKDNGRGFDSERCRSGQGIGLASLRDRARRAGGQITICSKAGHGTLVKVEVPAGSASSEGLS